MIDLFVALLKSLLTKVFLEEFGAGCTSLARRLVKRSVRALIADREQYEEQWLADLEDRRTPLRKLLFAIGLFRAAAVLRRQSTPIDTGEQPQAPAVEDVIVHMGVVGSRVTGRKVPMSRRPRIAARDPIEAIDSSIADLTYLTDWLLEDLDVAIAKNCLLNKDDIRALSALRAIRATLPRLRIVRSNFEAAPLLPDATTNATPYTALSDFIEHSRASLQERFRLKLEPGDGRADEPSDPVSENDKKQGPNPEWH